MSNKKVNSRNTSNPYELISGIKLISKYNKNISVGISATDFSYVSDNDGKKHLIMRKFDVNSKHDIKHNNDYAVVKLFKNIESFANKCKNPLEVITLFIDAYKENKNKLSIKIKTCPAYSDMLDSKFVYESLIN